MTDVSIVSIYINVVAIMLATGVLALTGRVRMKDAMEKRIFRFLLALLILMSIFYIITLLRDDGVLPCDHTGAMLIESGLELMINLFATQWFIYLDYRMYHSPGHLKRALHIFLLPFALTMLLGLVNLFTGILFDFKDGLTYTETPLYILCDAVRLGYFIVSLIMLSIHKRHDEKMRFFSVVPFFVPTIFYVLLYYFTPFVTVTLGLVIGLTLIYAELINEQCYMDRETGFFNRLYLEYLKGQMEKDAYDLESAMLIRTGDGDMQKAAALVNVQLPDDCDTIRIGRKEVLTLAHVKDRAPLHMLSEDVEMSFEGEDMPVEVYYDLKKKKESSTEFLERFLENV